jgi:hypothetical protein
MDVLERVGIVSTYLKCSVYFSSRLGAPLEEFEVKFVLTVEDLARAIAHQAVG